MTKDDMLPTRLTNIVRRVGEDRIINNCRKRPKHRAAEWLEREIPGVGKKSSQRLVERYWSPSLAAEGCTLRCAAPASSAASSPNASAEYKTEIVLDFVGGEVRRDAKFAASWKLVCKRIQEHSRKPWSRLYEELETVRAISASGDFRARVLRKFAQSVVARCEVAYTISGSQAEVEVVVTQAALCANPMDVFRRLRHAPFVQVDGAALENGWWSSNSHTRCEEAVLYEFEAWAVQKLCCTAVERISLAAKTSELIQQTEAFVDARIEQMTMDSRLTGYETTTGWLITTPRWSERASLICNFMADQERSPDPPFEFCDDSEEEEWRQGDMGMRDEHGCATDAFLRWLIDRVARDAGLTHPPTSEQLDCVLTLVKSTRSILTAEAGTGKTDYGLRLAVGVMERLGYAVLVTTPTHAAKRPIVSALGWSKKSVHTVKSLTFVPPWGAPPKLETILETLTRPLVVFLDEFGMCGTEDAAELFSILQRTEGAVRIVMSGDHQQLPPVAPGCPFDDMIRHRAVPICTMTRVFRAEVANLSSFNRIYRPGREDVKDWSLHPRSEYYILHDHPAVSHVATASMQEVQAELTRLVSHFASEGLAESELLVITNTNRHCLELSHTLRSIFRPHDEAARQACGRAGRTAAFARGDCVFFNHNTKWYKNGDETVVRDASLTTVDVDVLLDEEDHRLLLDIKKSRDKPNDDFWVKYRDGLPQDFRCLRDQTWTITVEQDRLKPQGAVTFYKSQGVQVSHVVVALCSGIFISNRHMYTGCTRARRRLGLIGPRFAFDNEELHTESGRRTTVLGTLLDEESHESCVKDRRADEPTAVDVDMRRTSSARIKKSLRMHTWKRFFSGKEWGSCRCCGGAVSVWHFHVCHIVSHADGGRLDDSNLCVGCPACNLRCGTRNFDAFSKARRARGWTILQQQYGSSAVSVLRATLSVPVSYGCRRILSTVAASAGLSAEGIESLVQRAKQLGLVCETRVPYMTYRLL